jgi:hypothetical protein
MSASARWAWLEVFLGAVLVGLAVAEIVLYSPPVERVEQSLSVHVKSVRSAGQTTSIQLAITHGSSDQSVQVAAFPLSIRSVRKPSIYVYADGSYPTAGVAPTVALGVFDHLDAELIARGYTQPVAGVTAGQLADVLRDTSKASERMVVMMTGVLPAGIFSEKVDLLSPWVMAGGIAVWGGGGTIGYWSGASGQPLTAANTVGEAGTGRLLGSGVVQYPTVFGREGTVQSSFGAALDISYRFASDGVLRDSVLSRGGLVLGWYSGPFSSVSYLPRGLGGYLIFGGEIPDEVSVSVDLATIVLSGAIAGAGPVAVRQIQLNGMANNTVVDLDLPFATPQSGIMLVAFDPSPGGVYFSTQVIGQ